MEKEKKCTFDIGGVCYTRKCFSGIKCGAEKNGYINRASDEEIRARSAEVWGDVAMKVPSENVASEESDSDMLLPDINLDYDREDGR